MPYSGAAADSAAAVSALLAASRLGPHAAAASYCPSESRPDSGSDAPCAPLDLAEAPSPSQQHPQPEQYVRGAAEHAAWGAGPPGGGGPTAAASGGAFAAGHDPFSDLGELGGQQHEEVGYAATCLDDYGRVVPHH